MNTTKIRNTFAASVVGAAIVAAPALVLIGAGTAQAASNFDPHAATTVTTQHPGHIAIQVEQPVSAPIVWGQYDSPTYILED
jgi:hypothetical protein